MNTYTRATPVITIIIVSHGAMKILWTFRSSRTTIITLVVVLLRHKITCFINIPLMHFFVVILGWNHYDDVLHKDNTTQGWHTLCIFSRQFTHMLSDPHLQNNHEKTALVCTARGGVKKIGRGESYYQSCDEAPHTVRSCTSTFPSLS